MVCKDCLGLLVLQETRVLQEIMALMESLASRVQEVHQEMMEMLVPWDSKDHLGQEECKEKRANGVFRVKEELQVPQDHQEKAWALTWLPCKQCWDRVIQRVQTH